MINLHSQILITWWNDKIVALEKMTWFHFRLMKTGFLFFVADHLLVGQLCTNPKSDRSLLSCLKVTQCLTSEIGDVPLYNSSSLPIQVMTTGPLPAPSKMEIWIATNNRDVPWVDEIKVSGYGYGLWCGFKWGPYHATSHLRSRLESQHQSVPGCAEVCGAIRWSVADPGCGSRDSAPAHKFKETQAWLQKECYDFVPFSHCPPPNPPAWTRWNTSFGHTSRISPTWAPSTLKPAWSPPSAEYLPSSRRRFWKRHAPSSGLRIEAVIEAEGGYIE